MLLDDQQLYHTNKLENDLVHFERSYRSFFWRVGLVGLLGILGLLSYWGIFRISPFYFIYIFITQSIFYFTLVYNIRTFREQFNVGAALIKGLGYFSVSFFSAALLSPLLFLLYGFLSIGENNSSTIGLLLSYLEPIISYLFYWGIAGRICYKLHIISIREYYKLL
ncbi:MAG: hypothetical protein MK212_20275 [Saprospiraceae bacterium]|nr:hypothetical protein [Saprospiraceae bacterium]